MDTCDYKAICKDNCDNCDTVLVNCDICKAPSDNIVATLDNKKICVNCLEEIFKSWQNTQKTDIYG